MNTTSNTASVGYLIVKVTTARGAIPLADASVTVRGTEPDTSGVLFSLRTNRDGQTERITLSTPPISVSEAPSSSLPYATYDIDVQKDGYRPLSFENVPIFPSILSIQPAVMIPAPEDFRSPVITPPSTVIPEPRGADL